MAQTSLPPVPREPIVDLKTGRFSSQWERWLTQVQRALGNIAGIAWKQLDKAGSSLADVETRTHALLTSILGWTSGADTVQNKHISQADGKKWEDHVDASQNVHGIGAGNAVVGTGTAQTLTGKKFGDDIVIPKTAGIGIKVDTAAPTFGWADLLAHIVVKAGPADPTLTVYQGSYRAYAFSNAVTNEVFLEFHIPHDLVPSSDIFIHGHWSQIVVDSGGAAGVPGAAKWSFDVMYAKGHQQAAFSAPITTSVTQTAGGTQYIHNIAEVQLSAVSPSATQLDSDDLEPDGIILVRCFRDPTDAADTLNQAPFLHFVDIHYRSTGVNTKQKAPNFYV